MKERPILFSAPMVRALLAGTKSQTRRIVKRHVMRDAMPHPEYQSFLKLCPYGQPGDRLWVRETWGYDWYDDGQSRAWKRPVYRADPGAQALDNGEPASWKPSIHMPHALSRITLKITGVRVERLQDISEGDAAAEGCAAEPFPGPWWQGYRDIGVGELVHQQAVGETPPEWMIEPKRMNDLKHLDRSAVDMYRSLWSSINGLNSWEANPWVWVIEFSPSRIL